MRYDRELDDRHVKRRPARNGRTILTPRMRHAVVQHGGALRYNVEVRTDQCDWGQHVTEPGGRHALTPPTRPIQWWEGDMAEDQTRA